jgi:hypothetical protein
VIVSKTGSSPGSGPSDYFTHYGVPDARVVFGKPAVGIKSACKKNFPLVGRVVDLQWKGNDFGLGIIERLNNDILIKDLILGSSDVNIYGHRFHQCWTMSTEWSGVSLELWNCYQAIAHHLLAEWPRQEL